MPSDTTRNTLIRQWELLKLLPKRGTGKTAKDLAATLNDAGFKVSKRQIERDLSTLSGPFPLDCKDQSIPYGWKWMDGRSVELPGLTVAEALSMKLVEETLQSLLPKSVIASLAGTFKHAHEKLASLDAENPNALWSGKVRTVHPSLPFLAPHINGDVLEVVQEALLFDKQLEIEYQAINAAHPSSLVLHPLGLVNRGLVSYIVATAFEYTDVRLYALHRVSRATKLAADTIRPVDFRLDDYIDEGALQFGNGKSISLKANVTKQLSLYLTETPLSTDQQMHVVAEKIKLTCTAIDSLQLRWWILSQGAEIEILAPAALRTNIANIFRQSAEIYEPEK